MTSGTASRILVYTLYGHKPSEKSCADIYDIKRGHTTVTTLLAHHVPNWSLRLWKVLVSPSRGKDILDEARAIPNLQMSRFGSFELE